MFNVLNKKWILFIVILYTILSGLLLNTNLPIVDEEPYYFLLSKSIFSGEGYNDIFYPHNPSNVECPPFYPLFLAIISIFFPKTIVGLKILSILFGIGSLVIICFLFCADCQRTLSGKRQKLACNYCWVLLLLICTSPLFIAYSVRLVAEMSYLFFSLITIFFLEKYTRHDNFNKLYFWGGTITLIFSSYIKTLGLSLVVAVFVYFLIKKKYKDLVIISGLFGFCFLPWIIRNILVSGVPTEYLGAIVSGYKISSLSIPKLIFCNIFHYGRAVKDVLLPGCFLSKLLWYLPSLFSLMNERVYFKLPCIWLFSVFLWGGLVFGFYLKAREKISLVEIYMLCYFLMLLFCPYDFFINDGNKYLYQVMPFLVYYLIRGFSGISQNITFLHFNAKKAIVGVLILIMAIPNLICDFYLIKGNINYLINYKNLSREEKLDYYAPWFNVYLASALWIKEKVPLNTVIMHNVPYTFSLHSGGHKTISLYLDKNDIDRNLKDIKEEKVGYIIVGNTREEKLIEELNRISEDFIFVPVVFFIRWDKMKGFSVIYKVVSVDSTAKKLYQEGAVCCYKKNYNQAILKFKQGLQRGSDVVGYCNLGIIYEAKGLMDKAINMYKKVLEIEPHFQMVENRLNIIYCKQFLRQQGGSLERYGQLGNYYLKNCDYQKAIDAYIKGLQIVKKEAIGDNKKKITISLVYYNLGKAHLCQGNYDKAIEEFKKSVEIMPEFKFKIKHYFKVAEQLKKKVYIYQ